MSFWWRSTRGLTCRYMDKTKKKKRNFFISLPTERSLLAWKNSRHFTTLPLVFPPKDVWETSVEILYWWRDTTQIWVVLLIGWKFASTNQKHYPDLGSVTSQVLDVCARFSDVISRENQWWCREKTAVFFRLVLCGLFDTFLLFPLSLVGFLPYFWIDGDNAVRPEQRTVSASKDGECKAHARKTGTVCAKVEKNYKINKILSPEKIFPPIFV